MDFYKAISILGLKPNFTEIEFKTAYRKLSQEYHPDKYEGTPQYELMQKKQQEINSAREFLKKQNKITNKTRTFDINEYLKYIKEQLAKVINVENENITNEDFIVILKEIKEDIKTFETDIANIYVLKLTKNDIDKAYNECIKKIKTKFENLKNLYYQKNGINEKIVKEKLNYDCTLKEFYLQLQQIEGKYGKISPIKALILTELEKYKYFAGYEKLKPIIDELVKYTLNKIKEDNFDNFKKYIEEMNREIIVIFQRYHIQIKKIKELEKEVYDTKKEFIIHEYEKLKKTFQSEPSFKRIDLEIEHLQKTIQKHHLKTKKEVEFQQNEQIINEIYQDLLNRYNKVIKSYNIITEYDTIIKFNELLNQVLKVFSKGSKNQEQIEFFNNFNQITFTDVNNDKEVLEKIIQDLKRDKTTIYLKKSENYPKFYYFDDENMIIHQEIFLGRLTYSKITEEELEKEYISLEELLESATFIGDVRKIFKTLIAEYLYETENLIIYSQCGKICVGSKEKLKDSTIIKEEDSSLEKFKDKKYLYEMIENQMITMVEKNKQQSSKTKR